MNALTFVLSGKTAFFKKPDVNTYAYFTYNNIHKIALLGILGSIIGLSGYKQQNHKMYPEFYDELKDLKISIVPISNNGYFSKKMQVFNNTTGFYNKDSKKNPCTLNYREQWLYKPKWRIYILNDNSINKEIFNKICDYIVNKKCEYIPYLGKNEHLAEITNSEIIDLKAVRDVQKVDSLFDSKVEVSTQTEGIENVYQMKETLPIKLNEVDNEYELNSFNFTNLNIDTYPSDTTFYNHLGRVLYFF